eukprot:g25611.t1
MGSGVYRGAKRKVINKVTGEVFPSVSAAAKHVERHHTSICQAILYRHKCAGAYWDYVDTTDEEVAPVAS